MSDDLKTYLIRIGTGAAIGLILGLLIRRKRPDWARRWATFVLSRRWKWFTVSALLFGAVAVVCWTQDQQPEAIGAGVLCLLSIVSLIQQGFKPIDSESSP